MTKPRTAFAGVASLVAAVMAIAAFVGAGPAFGDGTATPPSDSAVVGYHRMGPVPVHLDVHRVVSATVRTGLVRAG
jgi:hypothetical protein